MVVEPSILYFGTPVVLISTLNQDRSVNVAPMSSAWWLGWTACWASGTMLKPRATFFAKKNAF
jgi:flavin reductase (DIM6/NTAB) family NADH-FMN oxidoreductase RutF